MQRAEDPQEDFLRQVERFFAVAQEVGREAQHQAVVLEDEGRMGRLVAGQAALDERSFAAGDLGRPPDGFGRLQRRNLLPRGSPPRI